MDYVMYAKSLCLSAIFAALLWQTYSVSADDNTVGTGNELVRVCSEKNYQAQNRSWAFCVGYVAGVDNGLRTGVDLAGIRDGTLKHNSSDSSLIAYTLQYCVPGDVPREQMALVVAKFLLDNPEKLNDFSELLVARALRKAWPCHKKY